MLNKAKPEIIITCPLAIAVYLAITSGSVVNGLIVNSKAAYVIAKIEPALIFIVVNNCLIHHNHSGIIQCFGSVAIKSSRSFKTSLTSGSIRAKSLPKSKAAIVI